MAASDPKILQVGSIVQVDRLDDRHNGVYTIMDTGPEVQGRELDLYMWNCNEALSFGRKPIQVTVLRLGWNPQASTPSLVDRLFRRRERARAEVPPPAAPPPIAVEPAAGETDGAEGEVPATPPALNESSTTFSTPAASAPLP